MIARVRGEHQDRWTGWRPSPGRTLGQTEPPDVRFEQRLNEQLPLDATFRDEANRTVRLGDYFGDKPVILVLAYFRCPMLCDQVLNGLVRAMLDLPQRAASPMVPALAAAAVGPGP